LVEAGIIYGIVTHDVQGAPMILTVGACFLYLVIYLVWATRKVKPKVETDHPAAVEAEEEPHVLPTPWPLVFSVAAVLLVVGAVASQWFLLAGGIVFAMAGIGWFVDVVRQWKHPPTHPVPPGPATDVVDAHKGA
jgi:ribose/xylose/arabinose/galactoside ABC-type transport system permease subunit